MRTYFTLSMLVLNSMATIAILRMFFMDTEQWVLLMCAAVNMATSFGWYKEFMRS